VLHSQSRRTIVTLLAIDFVVYTLLFWNASNPTNLNNLLYGLLFFLLGRVCSVSGIRDTPSFLAIAALIALVAFGALGRAYDIGHRSLVPAAVSGIACLLILAVRIEKQGGMLAAALSCLGRYSMAIFLLHVMASVSTRLLLQQVFNNVNYWV